MSPALSKVTPRINDTNNPSSYEIIQCHRKITSLIDPLSVILEIIL